MKSSILVMMWKYSYINFLISWLLIPGLLVGCGLETGDSTESNEQTENTANIDNQNVQNLEPSLKDIQETYKQFQALLETFLGEIDEVINGSKNRDLVNSNEVNQKVEEIETKINQYKNNLPTTDAQVSGLFDDINLILNNIKPITEQLKDGLGKEATGKVQLYFGGLVSGQNSRFYGVLGPSTIAKIKQSLRGNSQQLGEKITQLPKGTDLLRQQTSTKTVEALNAEVAILKTEVRELRNKTNAQTGMMLIFSLPALGLAVVSMCFSLYKFFGQTGTKKQPPGSGSDKKHDPARQVESGIQEYASSVEANQKFGNYGVGNEISKRSKNMPQPEQNREVNVQQNPVQSNVTTPRAKQPVPSAENRPHQQTYSSGYFSSSGSQLVSAHNNDPRSFSDNGIAVEETKQSIEQRRLDDEKPIVFEKNRRGNYSIIKEGTVEYMIPKGKLKINEFNRQTVEVLFECQGYRPEYSGFKVIKPAIVSSVSRGEVWQLVERGVLQFY